MSVQTEIDRLQAAKAELKSAIEGKGVAVPDTATLDGYGALVGQIEQRQGGDCVQLDIEDASGGAYMAFVKTPDGYQAVPLYYGMPPLEVETGSVAVFALVGAASFEVMDVMVMQGAAVQLPDTDAVEELFGCPVYFSRTMIFLTAASVQVMAMGGGGGM